MSHYDSTIGASFDSAVLGQVCLFKNVSEQFVSVAVPQALVYCLT